MMRNEVKGSKVEYRRSSFTSDDVFEIIYNLFVFMSHLSCFRI